MGVFPSDLGLSRFRFSIPLFFVNPNLETFSLGELSMEEMVSWAIAVFKNPEF